MASKTNAAKSGKGFLSNFASSFAAIPCGIILIIAGCIFLWNNEKDFVTNMKDNQEMRNNVVDVKSDNVKTENDGKLIATSGVLDYGTVNLVDEKFGISLSTPILERVVEVYAWVEKASDDEDTPPKYDREWVNIDKIEDSSKFKSPEGHTNPLKSDYVIGNSTYKVKELKVGAFILSDLFIDRLKADKDLLALNPTVTLPEGYVARGNYITNTVEEGKPVVNDVRISYKYGEYDKVSVMGRQDGSTITSYTTKKKSSKTLFEKGTKDSNELLNDDKDSANSKKWIFRILGTILVCVGTSMLLSPLTTLIGYIPFLGKIVNGTLGVVSFAVGIAISLIAIAVAWLVFRPTIGVIMIVVSVGLVVLAKMYLSKKDDSKTSEVKEEKKEENKEEN